MPILSVIISLLFIVIATAMILIILIQRPQGGGLTGAFGGSGMGASQSAFGAKTGDMLTWATVTVFVLFLLSAMGMVWMNKALYLSGRQVAPTAPSELVVTALGPTEVELTWKDNSNNETEFIIERSSDGLTTWTNLTTVEEDSIEFVDSGLVPATQYFYRLLASNSYGPSSPTQAVPVTTQNMPDENAEPDTDAQPPEGDDNSEAETGGNTDNGSADEPGPEDDG